MLLKEIFDGRKIDTGKNKTHQMFISKNGQMLVFLTNAISVACTCQGLSKLEIFIKDR